MPISAVVDGEYLIGPLCSDDKWSQVRAVSKSDPDSVTFPATGAKCFPRVSKLGLKHFVSRAGTATGTETVEHELTKAGVAKVLLDNGWRTWVEYPSDDRSWVADVFGISPRGEKVAFEVQLSAQSSGDFAMRTRRYADAGVHTVWVVPGQPANEDLNCIVVGTRKHQGIRSVEQALSQSAALSTSGVQTGPDASLGAVIEMVARGETVWARPRRAVVVQRRPSPCRWCGKQMAFYHSGAVAVPSMTPGTLAVFANRWVRQGDDARAVEAVHKAVRDGLVSGPFFVPDLEAGRMVCPHCGGAADHLDAAPFEADPKEHVVLVLGEVADQFVWGAAFTSSVALPGQWEHYGGTDSGKWFKTLIAGPAEVAGERLHGARKRTWTDPYRFNRSSQEDYTVGVVVAETDCVDCDARVVAWEVSQQEREEVFARPYAKSEVDAAFEYVYQLVGAGTPACERGDTCPLCGNRSVMLPDAGGEFVAVPALNTRAGE